jgi:phenylacetate-CoA ligase
MSALFTSIYTRTLLPALSPFYRGIAPRMGRYAKLEHQSLEENLELQGQALRKLLRHAYATSPFYRKRFDAAGLNIESIKSADDLHSLPPLTREDLRKNLDQILSTGYDRSKLHAATTGGTTDTPLLLYRDQEAMKEKMAVQLRFNQWAGANPGDKTLYVWGAHIDHPPDRNWRWRFRELYLMRREWAPASVFNEETLEIYSQRLNRYKPRVLYAYPTPLALFAEYLANSGKPFHRPETAICTAEHLLPQQRAIIESTFGLRVFDHYGTRDFGMSAAECDRHTGLHINIAAVAMEFRSIPGIEDESLRELYVTDLLNYGMPMIRYKINDCVTPMPNPCPCGRGYPMLKSAVGRTGDVFVLSNGTRVPGISLLRFGDKLPGIKKLQIVQDTLKDFRFRFVPSDGFKPSDLEEVEKRLIVRFGSDIRLAFEPVPDIERERSGKSRMCISKVSASELRSLGRTDGLDR